jgi:hypothetical protein
MEKNVNQPLISNARRIPKARRIVVLGFVPDSERIADLHTYHLVRQLQPNKIKRERTGLRSCLPPTRSSFAIVPIGLIVPPSKVCRVTGCRSSYEFRNFWKDAQRRILGATTRHRDCLHYKEIAFSSEYLPSLNILFRARNSVVTAAPATKPQAETKVYNVGAARLGPFSIAP